MNPQIDEQKLYSDPKLKLKYEILNKIGEGCFGVIYKAFNRIFKRQVALKIQFEVESEDRRQRSNISNQIAILQKLKDVEGVPKFYSAGKWSCGYYMEIQLLSSSLYDERNKEFSEGQIYNMAGELISILKNIHSKGIIHQDLKPQNIMRNQKSQFVIIDFGLSNIIKTDSHELEEKKRGFIGTPRYASLSAHLGRYQKPKDDIQSLLYVLGAVFMKKAPWFQLKVPASKRLEKIQKYKQSNSLSWFKQCGHAFVLGYEYLMQLSSNEQVNYNYLIGLFGNGRKTTGARSLKMKKQNILKKQSNRRKSEIIENLNGPIINIHFVDRKKQKKQTMKYDNKEEEEDLSRSRSNNNFSEMAQDGYMQLLQFLTEKILNLSEENDIAEDSALVNSHTSKQPLIHNPSKYEALHFKNPFEFC